MSSSSVSELRPPTKILRTYIRNKCSDYKCSNTREREREREREKESIYI